LTADLVVIAIIVVSALFAFMRGFVREVLSVAAWIVAIVATIFGFPFLRPIVGRHIEIGPIADAVTAVSIFLVVLVVASIISHLLSRNVQTSSFSALDRSLGLLFGVARGALVVCALFLLADWFFPPDLDRRSSHPAAGLRRRVGAERPRQGPAAGVGRAAG